MVGTELRARFQSLRTRLLIPLAGCSLLAALAVGAVSYVLGDRVVERSMNSRFGAIRETLSSATFPLTPTVLKTLAELTGTELASYDAEGKRIESSHPEAPLVWRAKSDSSENSGFDSKILRGYQARPFARQSPAGNRSVATHVLVMFDERELQQSRIAAASLPLATGLSSTLLLSIVAWGLTQRLIHRIGLLEQSVERIAAGDFRRPPQDSEHHHRDPSELDPEDFENDELGRLRVAVRKMGNELGVLWEAVHRQERQKLIHQIAAGLAHQLRNSLTGARMAVELHARRWPNPEADALQVAVRELERTEVYVQRILRIASEQRHSGNAGTIGEATAGVRDSLQVVADHHHVQIRWGFDPGVEDRRVADATGLAAALENLVINAIQAGGDAVEILAGCVGEQVQIKVADNGPGPNQKIDQDMFEAFVTTKPEGLGLGLALVRRTAEDLGGDVRWSREDSRTVFVLTLPAD